MLRAVLNVLRGYRTEFIELETAILQTVRAELPAHLHAAFDDRLARITHIQPSVDAKEVILYETRWRKVRFSEEGRILASDKVIKIATVKLQSSDPLSRLSAGVHCFRGMVARLTFSKPCEHVDMERVTGLEVKLGAKVPWTSPD